MDEKHLAIAAIRKKLVGKTEQTQLA